MTTQSQAEEDLLKALRRHVAHGHGEIIVQIRPLAHRPNICSVRIQEGEGHLYEMARG